jgi:hypothetical protein
LIHIESANPRISPFKCSWCCRCASVFVGRKLKGCERISARNDERREELKVKIDKHQSILFNNFAFDVVEGDCYKLIFQVAIAHDKGKLAARQGRKAVSLLQRMWRASARGRKRLSGCRRRSKKAGIAKHGGCLRAADQCS